MPHNAGSWARFKCTRGFGGGNPAIFQDSAEVSVMDFWIKVLIETIGWLGTIAIVGAYGLLTTQRVTLHSRTYQWLNLWGSVGLMLNGAYNGAFPSMMLNFIWLILAARAIRQAKA